MPSVTTAQTVTPPPYKLSYDIYSKTLRSNDGILEPSDLAPLMPSTLDTPIEELRRRYEENGYVWIKGLLPREDVLRMRENYFKFLEHTGVLKPGTPAVAGIFDSSKDPSEFPGVGASTVRNEYPGKTGLEFILSALKAHSQDWYAEDFCKHPKLKEYVSKFSGWGENTVTFQRTLLRNNIPGTKAIGVHYDQSFLRDGEATAITAWVPIGDIRIQGGGLIYLEKSHGMGKEIEDDFTRKGIEKGFTEEEMKYAFNGNMMDSGLLTDGAKQFARDYGKRWLVADYEAGDVVFHHPFMIHASTVNEDPEHVIRLATDLRFADSSRPWDKRWMKVYEPGDGL